MQTPVAAGQVLRELAFSVGGRWRSSLSSASDALSASRCSMRVRVEPSARRALMRSRWIQRSSVWTLMPSSAAAGSGKRQPLTRSRRGPVTLSIAPSPRPHPTGCLTNLTPEGAADAGRPRGRRGLSRAAGCLNRVFRGCPFGNYWQRVKATESAVGVELEPISCGISERA